jgi:Fic family protein
MAYRSTYEQTDQSNKLLALLKDIDSLKEQIDDLRPKRPTLWPVIQEKLRVDWTYDSNAIEGSTLTRGETLFFLQEGLTVEGKPFKDFLDARNHAEAIDFLFQTIRRERQITTGLVKEINALLLAGVRYTRTVDNDGNLVRKPATPGEFKKQPNHVLQRNGTIHNYVDPVHVRDEIDNLCKWINDNIDKVHPVIAAAIAHYNFVRIHPFDDGNGREARLLMNLILMQKQLPPAVIKVENRNRYLKALSQADNGDLEPFIEFVVIAVQETMEMIVSELSDDKHRGKA